MSDERRCERNVSGYCPMHGQARPSCREPQKFGTHQMKLEGGAAAKRPESQFIPNARFIGTPVALWPDAIIFERNGTWYLIDGVRRRVVTDDEGTY